jgi:hypothetical protein
VNARSEVSSTPNPDILPWSFGIEYSLVYLQEHVKDVRLGAPFDRLIPLVEFSMSTSLDRHGRTTIGTFDPGAIWFGKYVQIRVEVVLPIKGHTRFDPGVLGQLDFFLDDLIPAVFSKPLFFV